MEVAGKNKVLVAFCTFPDAETARRVVREIIEAQLAACGNIVPALHSIYRWKEKIENGTETVVFFKLTEDRQSAFQEKLRLLHPYDVPEIIFLSVTSGLPEYFRWVAESCR